MITIKKKVEIKKLCASGLRFGSAVKVVKRYWDAGPGLVCMTCCDIKHQQMRSCGDQPQKYIIYTNAYKVEDYQWKVIGCHKRKGQIWVYITSKCVNYIVAHAFNSPWCVSRHKVEISAKKYKKVKDILKKKEEASNTSEKVKRQEREKKPSPQLDKNIELKENPTLSLIPALEQEVNNSPDIILEDENYTQNY